MTAILVRICKYKNSINIRCNEYALQNKNYCKYHSINEILEEEPSKSKIESLKYIPDSSESKTELPKPEDEISKIKINKNELPKPKALSETTNLDKSEKAAWDNYLGENKITKLDKPDGTAWDIDSEKIDKNATLQNLFNKKQDAKFEDDLDYALKLSLIESGGTVEVKSKVKYKEEVMDDLEKIDNYQEKENKQDNKEGKIEIIEEPIDEDYLREVMELEEQENMKPQKKETLISDWDETDTQNEWPDLEDEKPKEITVQFIKAEKTFDEWILSFHEILPKVLVPIVFSYYLDFGYYPKGYFEIIKDKERNEIETYLSEKLKIDRKLITKKEITVYNNALVYLRHEKHMFAYHGELKIEEISNEVYNEAVKMDSHVLIKYFKSKIDENDQYRTDLRALSNYINKEVPTTMIEIPFGNNIIYANIEKNERVSSKKEEIKKEKIKTKNYVQTHQETRNEFLGAIRSNDIDSVFTLSRVVGTEDIFEGLIIAQINGHEAIIKYLKNSFIYNDKREEEYNKYVLNHVKDR